MTNFIIENVKLFCEQILVYQDFPLLFICKDESYNRYIVLCSDAETFIYIIAKVSTQDIKDLLDGKLTMKCIFTQSEYKYKVITSDNIENDLVVNVKEFLDTDLPQDVPYVIYDKDVLEYRDSL